MTAGAISSGGISRAAQRPLVIVPMIAKGGGADDWPDVIATANALAGKGAVQLLADNGPFQCKSTSQLVSGAYIMGRPDVEIVSSLMPTGGADGFANSVFFAQLTPIAISALLTAQPALNSYTVDVNDDVANVGDMVILLAQGVANVGQVVRVLAKSGAGGLTYHLDDAIQYTYAVNSLIQPIVSPSDIRIEGNGMRVTGTGDRAVEIAAAQRCRVSGIRVTRDAGTFTAMGGSFDVGGRDNVFEDVEVDGANDSGGLTHYGFALETQVRSQIINARVRFVGNGGADAGFYLGTCAKSVVARSNAWKCYAGAQVVPSDVADAQGCLRTAIESSEFRDSATYGVLLSGGSNIAFSDVHASGNGSSGIGVFNGQGGDGGCTDLQIDNAWLDDNAAAGLWVQCGGVRARCSNLTCNRNGGFGIDFQATAAGSVEVDGYGSIDCVGGWFNATGAADLRITGFKVARQAALVAPLWQGNHGSTGHVDLSHGVAELNGTATPRFAFLVQVTAAGELYLDNVKTTGNATGTFGVSSQGVASRIRRGANVDLSSTVLPWNLDATAKANFGAVAANGLGTVQAVPAACEASDTIFVDPYIVAGQSVAPTIVAGANAFNFTAPVGDTTVYRWRIP